MKPIPLFILLCVLCVSAPLHALTWTQSKVELTPKADEATVTAYFAFTNKADVPVTIKKVTSSCSECTDLVWPDKVLAPGEAGELIATVKVVGISGKKSKFITVVTSETTPFPDRLELVIIAPEKLTLGDRNLRWEPNDLSTRTMPVLSAIPDAVPYLKEVKPAGVFDVTFTPSTPGDEGHKLKITPSATKGPARRALITIGLKTPDGTEYTESVLASLR